MNYPLHDISFIYVGNIRDLVTGYSFGELSCVISSLLPCTRRNDETKTPKGVKLVQKNE